MSPKIFSVFVLLQDFSSTILPAGPCPTEDRIISTASDSRPALRQVKPRFKLFYSWLKTENFLSLQPCAIH